MAQNRERAALSQIAQLGTLYDAHRDAFLDSSIVISGADTEPLRIVQTSKAVSRKSQSSAASSSNTFADKCAKLGVDPDLSISALAGYVPPRGLGAFLATKPEQGHAAVGVLYHTWTTRRQTLNLLSLSAPSWLNSAGTENQTATHVVTGILWGAQTVVVGRRGLLNPGLAHRERGCIKSELTRLASCIDDGKKAASVEQVKRENSHEATSFEIYSDLVAGDGAITTSSVRAASQLLQRIPHKLLSGDECSDVPIVFTLTPFSELQHLMGAHVPRQGPVPMSLEIMRQVMQQFDSCANAYRGSERTGKTFEACRSVKVEDDELRNKCSFIDLTEDAEDGRDQPSFEAEFRFELAEARAGNSTYNAVLEFLRRRRGVSAARPPRESAQPSVLLPSASSSPATRVKTLKEEEIESDILSSPVSSLLPPIWSSPPTQVKILEEEEGESGVLPTSVSSLAPGLMTTLKRDEGDESRQTVETDVSYNEDDRIRSLVAEGKARYVTSDKVAEMVQQEQDLYVFYFDDSSRGTPAWEQNIVFLSTCAEDPEDPNVIALCNCMGHAEASPTPRLDHYHDGQLLCEDVVQTPLNCIAMYDGSELVRDVMMPQHSRVIEVACPSENCDSLSPRVWYCDVCNTQLRYAEDGFIYCVCGRNPIDHFEFQCSSDLHGEEFVKYEAGLFKSLLDALLGENETVLEDEFSARSQAGETDLDLEDQEMEDLDISEVMSVSLLDDNNDDEERNEEQTEVESLNEVNILLLGESGVGKSLFVNAFLNYMRFASLDEAMSHDDLVFSAPLSQSPRSDRTSEASEAGWISEEQKLGKQNANGSITDGTVDTPMHSGIEDFDLSRVSHSGRACSSWQEDITEALSSKDSSESETGTCVVHKLTTGGRTVRVIDSPGLANDFPSEQNKSKMADVVTIVGRFGTVHGILVLLNPVSPRLALEGCVSQLLSYFHRDAAPNVAFGFTRSAQSPRDASQDAYKRLKEMLSQLESRDVRTDQGSVFFFDSECYLFLAAAKKGMIHVEDESRMAAYRNMWEQAAQEACSMIDHFEGLFPHIAQSTVDLNLVRRVVGGASKPMAEVLACVLDTIRFTQYESERLQLLTGLTKNSESFVRFTVETSGSRLPRTVCQHPGCVVYFSIADGELRPFHTSSCHQQCPLLDVAEEVAGEAGLEFCEAMDGSGNCEICSHSWREHLHTFNDQIQEVVKVPLQVSTSKDDCLEMFLQECNEAQEVIMNVGARFSHLLQRSSITLSGGRDMISFLDGIVSAQTETVKRAAVLGDFWYRMASKRYMGLYMAVEDLRGRVAALGKDHEQDGSSDTDGLFGGESLDAMIARLSNLKLWGEDFDKLIRPKEARRQ